MIFNSLINERVVDDLFANLKVARKPPNRFSVGESDKGEKVLNAELKKRVNALLSDTCVSKFKEEVVKRDAKRGIGVFRKVCSTDQPCFEEFKLKLYVIHK